MEDSLKSFLRPLVALISGFLAFSCSNDAFGPAVTDSPAVPPKVLSVSPANRSIGPFDDGSTVVIEFSKSMNESSLRKAVTLLEPTSGAEIETSACWMSDAGHRHWVLGGLHELDWEVPTYLVGRHYRLTIGSAAADVFGNHLAPYWYEFTPEPYFRLKSVQPWASMARWDCWFNSPVDSAFFSYAEIEPPMNAEWVGEGDWSSHWVMSGLNVVPGRIYTLTIRDGAHDRYGNPFEGTKTFSIVFSPGPGHTVMR